MWAAIGRMIDESAFPTRAQSALQVFRTMLQEMIDAVATRPLAEALEFIIDRSGYQQMLESEDTPEAANRLENLNELTNAAAEAAERGEKASDFLDHAALVSEADALDAQHPGDAAHHAQRQGPRVSGGLHRRDGGRSVSALALARFRRRRWKRSGGCATWG